jgi:hypothetical protein
MKKLLLLALPLFIISCAKPQGDERLTEKAYLEAKAGAEGQTENQNKKAEELELDLQKRFQMIEGISGVFEGMVVTERANYKIKVSASPSLPRVKHNRKRLLDEVVNDLNRLSMNIQILMWRENMPQGAVGCLSSGISPDFQTTKITIASDQCPGMYFMESIQTNKDRTLNGTELSEMLYQGSVQKVNEIKIKIQPTSNANVLNTILKRVE